ncbi:MAG: hypothetical protein GY750_14340 [Lentisphaerae bacterium]|nr:hypothetical protein [Lentisphaerota bacterium]MCP4102580.1 hypothetical protein [Lentisphaerota bacterium]
MTCTTKNIISKCERKWRSYRSTTNDYLSRLKVVEVGRTRELALIPDSTFALAISQMSTANVHNLMAHWGRLAYYCEIAMGLNMGKVFYTTEHEHLYDSWDFTIQGAPSQYPIKNETVLRWEILRKVILTSLGLNKFYEASGNSAALRQVKAIILETVNKFRTEDYTALNDRAKRKFKALPGLPTGNDSRKKFLLRCGQVGCCYKFKPSHIHRTVSNGGTNRFTLCIREFEFTEDDKTSSLELNLDYLRKKTRGPMNVLLNAVAYDNKVMTSQARKFLPFSPRNTYTVDFYYNNRLALPKPIIITASPAPDEKKGLTSQSDLTMATTCYYKALLKSVQQIDAQGENAKLKVISLITETGYFFGKCRMGTAGRTAGNIVSGANNGRFKRSNEEVTFTKGPGMLKVSQQAIALAYSQVNVAIHCESGVDRAGTALEHIIYTLINNNLKGHGHRKAVDYVCAMANCAFSAMMYNIQFGIKPKAIYFEDLARDMPARNQGTLSSKNKEFMAV